jgi:hypothetical protein
VNRLGMPSWRTISVSLAFLVLVSACSGGADPDDEGLPRRTIPPPADEPYVSVAVDNHFHDIHVEDDITIAFEQGFIVKNQGSNLHNVTIPEIEFSKDIRPGQEVDFLGDRLAPGTYSVVCKYHASEGMVGSITVRSD